MNERRVVRIGWEYFPNQNSRMPMTVLLRAFLLVGTKNVGNLTKNIRLLRLFMRCLYLVGKIFLNSELHMSVLTPVIKLQIKSVKISTSASLLSVFDSCEKQKIFVWQQDE